MEDIELTPYNQSILKELTTAKMPFGSYKGRRICHLPEHYLVWYHAKGFPLGKLGTLMHTMYEIKLNGLEYLLEPIKQIYPTKTMNILIVVKRFDYGGSQNHACDLANSLSERNHNVYLVGTRGRQEERLSPKVNYRRLNFDKFFILYNIILPFSFIARRLILFMGIFAFQCF